MESCCEDPRVPNRPKPANISQEACLGHLSQPPPRPADIFSPTVAWFRLLTTAGPQCPRPLGGSKKWIPLRVPKNDAIVVQGTIWGFYFLILPGVWGGAARHLSSCCPGGGSAHPPAEKRPWLCKGGKLTVAAVSLIEPESPQRLKRKWVLFQTKGMRYLSGWGKPEITGIKVAKSLS